MKIYTKSGDRGKTSLFSGERVPKYHRRVEAYGDVDELNSVLGILSTVLTDGQEPQKRRLQRIQADLFQIGAWLATSEDSPMIDSVRDIEPTQIADLESAIDRMQTTVPELKGFILPGGHPGSGYAHLARTICRRAERHVVALAEATGGDGSTASLHHTTAYLNRLSDYLFVLARHCNHSAGGSDTLWTGR